MRIAARCQVRSLYVVGLFAVTAVLAVTSPEEDTDAPLDEFTDPLPKTVVAPPRESGCRTLSPGTDARVDTSTEDEAAQSPESLLAGYDAIAVALLNDADVSDREVEARLQAVPGIGAAVEVRTLRENERLILWDEPPPRIHGGGARASIFVREAETWRQAGYVDSQAWTSSVWLAGIDAEQGIALLVESYDGNGWPPSRVVALAVAGGRLVSVAADDIPSVEIYDEAGPRPTVRLWRRTDGVNRYPSPPMRGSHWRVRRARGGLVATETPITPWVDALASFCADPQGSNAAASLRTAVARCDSEAVLRWATGRRLAATLDLVLRCGEEAVHVHDGELQLEMRRGRWRVVTAPGCLENETAHRDR